MKIWEKMMDRRQLLAASSLGALTVYFRGLDPLLAAATENKNAATKISSSSAQWLRDFGPINRTMGDSAPAAFSGDDFSFPHNILWDIPGYLKGRTIPPAETHEVVIIGGGVSGVLSAYNLRDHKPVVLEQAARFGGNAKGESWRGMDYSIGAAYIDLPSPGTAMHDLYEDLKLSEVFQQRHGNDPVEYQGKLISKFWEGETEASPEEKAKYQKIQDFFSALNSSRTEVFPNVPPTGPEELKAVSHYDQWSLYELLTNVAGGKLPHQLEVALEHFCWSTYAASTKELSATAGLNFLAREDSPICVAAGGNSRIVERVLEKLLETIPASNFRPRSMAIDVRVEGDGVRVLYADIEGNLHHIKAKAVVMSCPKFVVKHIVHDLEPERVKAIESLRYRAYMTANVLVKDKLPETIYDVFLTGNGHDDHQRDYSNIKKAQAEQNATDFVIANFAAHGHDFGVMTFYRAFPFDGARQELIQPTSYETYKKKFEQQITDQILPLMKVKPSQVVDLRLTRWGHALPLSWKGVFKDGVPATLRKPFKNRVFFVEQDNWVYPATETGVTEAATWAPEIKKVLKGQA